MDKFMAYCGVTCHDCGAFLATQADDQQQREDVARDWSLRYKIDIKPEAINCSGCQSETGVKFEYCAICDIRQCARNQSLENCGLCPEYACRKLDLIFQNAPDARKRLGLIHRQNRD